MGTNLNMPVTIFRTEDKMSRERVLCIRESETVRKIEIRIESVVAWSLIFTNAFFVPYFFGKLFQWI